MWRGGGSNGGGARRSISILFCVWPFLLLVRLDDLYVTYSFTLRSIQSEN